MLDVNIKTQLKAYLEKLVAPIELVASLDDSPKSAEMRGLLEDIAGEHDAYSVARRVIDSPSVMRKCSPGFRSALAASMRARTRLNT